uniref:Acetyl-coenzyme A carboxylase carboxyl transferase subunit beta, chloroplastic n=1 Tax=Pherosphaera fitzgeraldii TaxID=56896 RepID=A0A3T0ZDS6_9CONI|nr:acetyl-CoA carboxylase carboxyltransferase beta subunit [Pherosphaera fitzgeraldii]BBB44447.1 acetyl-CoA carboxylase beta subunit [Pherosphaera fitzgeraldii]BBF91021.1 acetyl-CoA carboxylase beta subunit [Pherosphaera fitzgeraldii]
MTLREWHEERRRINRVIEDLTEKANHLAIVKEGDENTEHPQLIDNERLRQLWAQCDNCDNMQFRKYLRQNMGICQDCGFPMQMSSSDRIELLLDPGTWFPMDENICTIDVFSEFENLRTEEKMEIPWQINRKNLKIWIDFSWNFWIYYSFLLWEFFPQIEEFLLTKKIFEKIMEEGPSINENLIQDIEYPENLIQEIEYPEKLMQDIKYLEEKFRNSFNEMREWTPNNNKENIFNILKNIFRRYLKQILMNFALICFLRHIFILEKIDLESLEVQSFKKELQGILLYGKIVTLMDSCSLNSLPEIRDSFSEDTEEEVDPFSEQFWDDSKFLRAWKKYLEQYTPVSAESSEEFLLWLNWWLKDFPEDSEEGIPSEEAPSLSEEVRSLCENIAASSHKEPSPSEETPEEEVAEEEIPEDSFSEQFLEEYNILPCEEQAQARKLALEIQKIHYMIYREKRNQKKLREEGKKEERELNMEEKPYMDHVTSYQIDTGLTDAIQTGMGRLNGIPIAIGVMDFQFMGGSMGSVVGEKMTRLIEYATKKSLPLITVCASGGARMQEGSFSLMQMGKIASALNIYQRKKKLFYISILTSPTTGGVTASFGMLPNITIAEPKAYIAFAGRRVIEQTLNLTIEDEDFQTAEYLFHHGLFDLIVPRSILKGVLSDILKLYKFNAVEFDCL